MKVLVTGAAGFIGMHLALRLKRDGAAVTGVDNLDPYYDVGLKRARADRLGAAGVACETVDLATAAADELLRHGAFSHVVHLAAQPGVRYSLVNPKAYLRNNVDAFGAVLEGCRHAGVAHLVYASSSSVYGANHTLPFSEEQNVDHPVSLYAATKKANELMAHSYSHLYALPTTGLRFFTVYGPWGRPDMAPILFTRAILAGEPIKVFNHGDMQRDFTYVDDIVEGVVRVLARPPRAGGREQRALRDLQHRQPSGGADRSIHRRAGTASRSTRDQALPAAATGGRAGNVRVHCPHNRCDRLCADNAARGRARALRGLVSRVLRRRKGEPRMLEFAPPR